MSSRGTKSPVGTDDATLTGAEPALSATDLVKTYRVRDALLRERQIRAVDGVSFTVAAGETLAIVGESGCGKSTLGRLLLRLTELTSGTIQISGLRIDQLSQREFRTHRSRIQMVFQDPFTSFDPRLPMGASIREVIEEGLSDTAVDIDEMVAELVRSVGMDPMLARRFPSQLSGGQLQRFSVARALATRPDVLFLDEPTSALDVAVRGQIVNLLMDHQATSGLTFVLVSHDLRVVFFMADRVAVMYLGELVEVTNKDALFERPLHPYTRGLISAAASQYDGPAASSSMVRLAGELEREHAELQGCRLMPRCPFARPECAQPQVLRDVGGGHMVRCWRALELQV